jgi:hypothetical protein
MDRLFRVVVLGILVCLFVIPFGYVQSSPLSAPVDSAFGVNSHSASRYPDPSSLNVPADAVESLKVGWVREDFQFFRIQPERETFEWMFHDNAVDELTSRGVNIIGLIGGPTPAWATPGNPGGDFYPPHPEDFASFAEAVVSRYKDRVHYWEVWNEPDNGHYWKPTPSIEAYTHLLKVTSAAIKRADPNARVLVAGMVSPEPATSSLQVIADNGGWGAFDIISLHPYTDPMGPEEGNIASAGLGQVQALSDRLGSKPIWVTEFGWSTGPGGRGGVTFSEEDQASYIVRGAAMLRAAGAERVLVYKLKDESANEMYGLLKPGAGLADYSQTKPSYFAYKTLNEQLAGTTPVGMLDMGEQVSILNFESFGGWSLGNQTYGGIAHAPGQGRSGSGGATISYNFPSAGNDYLVFQPSSQPTISGNPGQLGLWVNGDGSGHALKVWLRDAEGETLQFRLGFVGGSGWKYLSVPLGGQVESWNVVSGSGNRQLNFPARLVAIVLDDEPDTASGPGSFVIDDLVAVSGPEAYGARFAKGDGSVVDVLWAPNGGTVTIGTNSSSGTLYDRWGGESNPTSSGGGFTLNLGPSPVFLNHVPGTVRPVEPAPAPTTPPEPTPTQSSPSSPPSQPDPVAAPDARTAFQGLWSKQDRPVAEGRSSRSWTWGPEPVSTVLEEQLNQGPGGVRRVQYYDKSRMEINDPDADPTSQWYITNGLLPIEMMMGRVQVGADFGTEYEQREPAEISVIGDPGNFPTYADLFQLYENPGSLNPANIGQPVTSLFNPDGSIGSYTDYADDANTVLVQGDNGHGVARAFQAFMNQEGYVYENGRLVNRAIYSPPVFVFGMPVSEPYWVQSKVGGKNFPILFQVFERRVLTYNPANDPAFRVEMGNVGQHYYQWRYSNE